MSVTAIPSFVNQQSKRHVLSPLERQMIVTVLEETIDQLSILETTIPSIGRRSSTTDSLSEALVEILENQQRLQQKFHSLTNDNNRSTSIKSDIHTLSVAAQTANNVKIMGENMKKLQIDRSYLETVLQNTLDEVNDHGTIDTLRASVREYQEEKQGMQDAIKRTQINERKIISLRKQIKEVKKDRDEKILKLDEEIAHCKDQLQEIKARTGLVNKFIKKQTEVRVQCGKRHHQLESDHIQQHHEKLSQQLLDEKQAHSEVENYLKKHIEDLDGKVEYWMERYEKDLDLKIKEVQDLKAAKTTGLQKLDELSKNYKEREEVVVEQRAMKERQRRKEEHEKKQNQTATKLQSWWRGVMVRKKLGPYGKGKKKGKGKKGKKGKKGGKKGKKGKKGGK